MKTIILDDYQFELVYDVLNEHYDRIGSDIHYGKDETDKEFKEIFKEILKKFEK